MKHKKKPYSQRKVFKRKTGGPKFWRRGLQKGGQSSLLPIQPDDTSIRGLTRTILEAIGFKVGFQKSASRKRG